MLLDALRAEGLPLTDFLRWSGQEQAKFWRDRGGSRLAPRLEIAGVEETEALAEALLARGVRWTAIEDPAAPPFLRRLAEGVRQGLFSPVFFWSGDGGAPKDAPALGIVGRTDPTPYAAMASRRIARQAAEAGIVIVSGLARGVDQAAHLGALEGGGFTLAFLPQGLLTVETPERLRREIGGGQLTISSPWDPRSGWSASLAVRRNSMIAAASDGLIAVEFRPEGGGTRRTVEAARQWGRPVWTPASAAGRKEVARGDGALPAGFMALEVGRDGGLSRTALDRLRGRLVSQMKRAKTRETPAQGDLPLQVGCAPAGQNPIDRPTRL